MSSREAIMAKVRQGLSDVPAVDPSTDVPVTRPDQTRHLSSSEIVDMFAERVADYRAAVRRASTDTVAVTIRRALKEHRSQLGAGPLRILVPPGFPDRFLPDAANLVHDGPTVRISELTSCDGVLSTSAVGIAETGTIVLDHGPGQGRRVATLVPDLHVCLIRAEDVVATVPEAVAALDARRPQTWISGPSATSDIELDRVEGVHGPRSLHVLIIDDE